MKCPQLIPCSHTNTFTHAVGVREVMLIILEGGLTCRDKTENRKPKKWTPLPKVPPFLRRTSLPLPTSHFDPSHTHIHSNTMEDAMVKYADVTYSLKGECRGSNNLVFSTTLSCCLVASQCLCRTERVKTALSQIVVLLLCPALDLSE